MDDRLLAHLKLVIVNKMRRNEPFLLSWDVPSGDGSGRRSVWLHPSIPMQFVFQSGKPAALNPAWIDLMMRASMSSDGLRLMPEPSES